MATFAPTGPALDPLEPGAAAKLIASAEIAAREGRTDEVRQYEARLSRAGWFREPEARSSVPVVEPRPVPPRPTPRRRPGARKCATCGHTAKQHGGPGNCSAFTLYGQACICTAFVAPNGSRSSAVERGVENPEAAGSIPAAATLTCPPEPSEASGRVNGRSGEEAVCHGAGDAGLPDHRALNAANDRNQFSLSSTPPPDVSPVSPPAAAVSIRDDDLAELLQPGPPDPSGGVLAALLEERGRGPNGFEIALAEVEDLLSRDPAAPAPVGVFEITDTGKAAWVIGKLLDRAAQRDRLKEQFRRMDKELERDLQGLAYRFGAGLEEWLRCELAKLPRRKEPPKSVKTLQGTLGSRTVKGGLSIADEAAVRAWALEQADPEEFGRYVSDFKVDAKAVLAHAAATGEDVPGLERTQDRENYYVAGKGVRVPLSKLRAKGLPAPEQEDEPRQIAGGEDEEE